jgi:hypothetical protein
MAILFSINLIKFKVTVSLSSNLDPLYFGIDGASFGHIYRCNHVRKTPCVCLGTMLNVYMLTLQIVNVSSFKFVLSETFY